MNGIDLLTFVISGAAIVVSVGSLIASQHYARQTRDAQALLRARLARSEWDRRP